MKKRVLSILLVLVLTLACFPVTTLAAKQRFLDLTMDEDGIVTWDGLAGTTYTVKVYQPETNYQSADEIYSGTVTGDGFDLYLCLYNLYQPSGTYKVRVEYGSRSGAGNFVYTSADWNLLNISGEGLLTWDDVMTEKLNSSDGYRVRAYLGDELMGEWDTMLGFPMASIFDDLRRPTGTYKIVVTPASAYFEFNKAYESYNNFYYKSSKTQLSAPANLRWEGTVAKWDAVTGADGYVVIHYSADGSAASGPSVTATQFDFGTEDTMRYGDTFVVTATSTGAYLDSEKAESPFYGKGTRDVFPKALDNTFHMTLGENGVLTWDAVPGAESYQIYIWNKDNNLDGDPLVTENRFPFVLFMDEHRKATGPYSIDIKPKDADGKLLSGYYNATSGTFQYVSPYGKLDAPTKLRWEGTVAKWDAVEGAVQYQVALRIDAAGSNIAPIVTGTQYDFAANLTPTLLAAYPYIWFTVQAKATENARASAVAEGPQYQVPTTAQTVTITLDYGSYILGEAAPGTLTLTTDQGTVTVTDVFEPKSLTATVGSTVTVKATPREGKMFKLWLLADDAGNNEQVTDAEYSFTAQKDIQVYSLILKEKNTEQTYTVHFDANGGAGTMMDIEDLKAGYYTLPANEFTPPEGMQFKGWSLTPDGEVEDMIVVDADKTVYAIWEKIPANPVTIAFDANFGTGNMDHIRVEKGKPYVLPKCGFTAPAGKEFVQWDRGPVGLEITATEDMTLVAMWAEKAATEAVTITRQEIPLTGTTYASTQIVELDGNKVSIPAYALKNEKGYLTNYVRVRDLAVLLEGTAGNYDVDWNSTDGIVLTSHHVYEKAHYNGTEGNIPFTGDQPYKAYLADTMVDGKWQSLTAFQITHENRGHTYYQLRDLGKALGFNVGWTGERGMFIETDKPYSDAD